MHKFPQFVDISVYSWGGGVQYFINTTVCTQAKCLGETLISVSTD